MPISRIRGSIETADRRDSGKISRQLPAMHVMHIATHMRHGHAHSITVYGTEFHGPHKGRMSGSSSSTDSRPASGGSDFQVIEIGDLEPTPSEPQLLPTFADSASTDQPPGPGPLPEGLAFVSVSGLGDGGDRVTGTIDSDQSKGAGEGDWGGGAARSRRPPGKAAQFIESKGFGWLLEVEEEAEEEERRPLL